MGDKGGAIELFGPVGAETAMCRAADRVFVDAHPRCEETGNKVIIGRAGTAGHDHAADRELLEAADIRPEASHRFFGLELDQAGRTDCGRRTGRGTPEPIAARRARLSL